MAYLPLANIMHHKLRSALSALGIGMGICMLVTLSGLARGSLFEIADRWESVDADLTVFARGWGENAGYTRGVGLSDSFAKRINDKHGDIVERVVPVFLWPMKLGGQDQMAAGVDPGDWHTLIGKGNKLIKGGRLFDPEGKFADWIMKQVTTPADGDDDEPLDFTEADLSHPDHNGLELIIDTRLARAGPYELNQTVEAANHRWKIVGIVPAGAMTRVFIPRRTAQYLFGGGQMARSTLLFVKLKDGVDVGPAARKLRATTRQDVVPLDAQRSMLMEKFGLMFLYVDVVNVVALVIAFLFVMITLYTMVLQQTRDIAILKANGAGNGFILRQVLGESMLLTGMGAAVGIALSPMASWLIQTVKPLLTVTITWDWIAIAVGASFVGAIISAIYPAWRATRVDIVTALTLD